MTTYYLIENVDGHRTNHGHALTRHAARRLQVALWAAGHRVEIEPVMREATCAEVLLEMAA